MNRQLDIISLFIVKLLYEETNATISRHSIHFQQEGVSPSKATHISKLVMVVTTTLEYFTKWILLIRKLKQYPINSSGCLMQGSVCEKLLDFF